MSGQEDAAALLRLVAGPDAAGWIELRFPTSQRERATWGKHWHLARDVDEAAIDAIEIGQVVDVYAGTALRLRQRGRSEDVDHAWLLSADCDDDHALDRLSLLPRPGLTVASGRRTASGRQKLHAHWPLTRPVDRSTYEQGKARIAAALGSDSAICDAARIMRIPGTRNHKADGGPVSIVDQHDDRFDPDELVDALPPVPLLRDYTPRGATDDAAWLAAQDDGLKRIPPPVYVRALTALDVPDRGGKLACFLPGHDDHTPSLHVYRDPWDGWFCFGCRRGGSAYDLAAYLHGAPMPLRGAVHLAVRAYLVEVLAGELGAMSERRAS